MLNKVAKDWNITNDKLIGDVLKNLVDLMFRISFISHFFQHKGCFSKNV